MANKRCSHCKREDLSLDQFAGHRGNPDGLQYWCKECHKAYRKERYENRPHVSEKLCSTCGEVLSADNFYKDKSHKSGLASKCKDCTKKHINANYDPVRQRHYRLAKNYGITMQEYEEMFELQEGTCAICGDEQDDMLFVDHDHETGEVRGLLCLHCNSGIGYFGDDVSKLEKAIAYLHKEEKVLA